jgi:hypothetical protein
MVVRLPGDFAEENLTTWIGPVGVELLAAL